MPITSKVQGEAYAAFLEEQNRRRRQAPLAPIADGPTPVEEEQSYFQNPAKYNQKPFDNAGFDLAGDFLSSAGKSFKNAATGRGVATMLPEMQFYPGGPTGLEKVYGGIADTGLGLFSTIVAGISGLSGLLAEQVPFVNENSEDRLSNELMAMAEFGEIYAAPYIGIPLNFSKIARLGQQGNRLPSMDLRLQDGPELNASLAEFAAAERQQNFAQQPLLLEDLRDDIDPDFVPIEDVEDYLADLRIDPEQPIDIVDTTPPAGALVDDEITDIVDYEMVPDDDFDIDVDLDDDDMQERIQDVIQSLQDRDLPDPYGILDDTAEAADEVSRAAETARIEEAIALAPVTSIEDAVNTEQLRELYANYNLPIPTTEAEELAANIIIESNNKKSAGGVDGLLSELSNSIFDNVPYSQRVKYTPPEEFRQGADLEYLKLHAPADVYNKQGPTMLEAKLTEQQEGRLGTLPPINSGNDGPRIAPEFYSAAVQAAKKLNVKSASYPELKRLMLKQKGVKIKELEWSGADEAFEGRKDVTPQELVEYLEDNTNLIEAKTIEGGTDYSGDIRVLEERYVDRELPALLEDGKETFIDEWEDDFPDIDKISDLNNQSLDEYAAQVDGVSNGQELAEKYPDGYIGQKEGNSLVPNGVTLVFNNAQKAAEYEWNNQGVDIAREELRESLEEGLSDAQGTNEYLDMLFPDGWDYDNRPDWAENMDTELEYAEFFPKGGTNMRETTYQFRDPTGKLDDDYFREAHFGESNREENLVAHARTAEFPVEGGGRDYHLGEAQSDMQQGIRRRGTTPRTREQEVTAKEVESINQSIGNMVRNSENVLNQTIFNDNIGIATASRREQHPEKLETYRTIIAD